MSGPFSHFQMTLSFGPAPSMFLSLMSSPELVVAVQLPDAVVGQSGLGSQASPIPSPSVSVCEGLATVGQLSHASPTPSPSVSVWALLETVGQLSHASATKSPS